MRRPIAVTLAIIAGMLVAFTAYVWVGNWFTERAATGTPLFGGGTCLSNGESFTYVVQVAIGAVTDSPSRGRASGDHGRKPKGPQIATAT